MIYFSNGLILQLYFGFVKHALINNRFELLKIFIAHCKWTVKHVAKTKTLMPRAKHFLTND